MSKSVRRALTRFATIGAVAATAVLGPVTGAQAADVGIPTSFTLDGAAVAANNVTGTSAATEQLAWFREAGRQQGIDVDALANYVVYQLPEVAPADVVSESDASENLGKESSYLIVPEGTPIESVSGAYSDGVVSASGVLEAIPLDVAQDPVIKGAADGAGQPYWRRNNENCFGSSNNTAWWFGCWRIHQLWNDGSYSNDYWNIEYFATAKGKSTWQLYKFSVGTEPHRGWAAQTWEDWEPRSDTDRDNCRTTTVGVQVKGATMERSYTQCDKWDISFYGGNPGQFSNWWRGGSFRSEREVAMTIAVRTANGRYPAWYVPYHYYAR